MNSKNRNNTSSLIMSLNTQTMQRFNSGMNNNNIVVRIAITRGHKAQPMQQYDTCAVVVYEYFNTLIIIIIIIIIMIIMIIIIIIIIIMIIMTLSSVRYNELCGNTIHVNISFHL